MADFNRFIEKSNESDLIPEEPDLLWGTVMCFFVHTGSFFLLFSIVRMCITLGCTTMYSRGNEHYQYSYIEESLNFLSSEKNY